MSNEDGRGRKKARTERHGSRLKLAVCAIAAAAAGCGGGGGDSGGGNGGNQPLPPPPPPIVSKGSVSLLAGAIGGAGNLDGSGAAARFDGPSGLALGPDGNLYVADLRNQRIRKVTRTGLVSTFAGSGEAGYADGPGRSATFCWPSDVALDPAGNVFVATDTAVRRITPDAVVTTVAGAGSARCGVYDANTDRRVPPASPSAVAADALGIVYIGDSYFGAVYKLTPDGALSRFAGSDDPANPVPGLGYPSGIALDAMRNVYVADRSNNSIVRIAQSGQLTTLVPFSAALGSPGAIAADALGNVFVLYPDRHVVRKVTPSGEVSVVAGTLDQPGSIDGPRASARLDTPQGVALSSDGSTLFVSEGANTIRRIDLSSGTVSTLAGLATPRAPNFGAYHATDRAGNVYVAVQVAPYPDSDFAIRRIAPDGTQTTLVATGLDDPRGIAIDESNGNVYVADLPRKAKPCPPCPQFAVVYRITPQGVMTPLAGSLTPPSSTATVDGTGSAAILINPTDLAIDGSGNLYLAEFAGPLRKITADRVVTTVASKFMPPSAAGAALSPQGVAVDKAGNVYLTVCPYYGRSLYGPSGAAVLKANPRGEATVLAGSLTEVGFIDGAGAQARFGGGSGDFCAKGITLDAAGNVFVADTSNNAVRKITPDGTVSTVVGQPGVRGIALGSLPASLSAPTDVSFDGAGNLYVGSAHAVLKVRFGD